MVGKLKENLSSVQQKIAKVREQNPNIPQPILLAVSKKQSAEKVSELFKLGVEDFGENYLQEALAKKATLKSLPIRWHYIGQLQTKKIKDIVGEFSLIQTLSRKSELDKISEIAQQKKFLQKVLIQVNVAGEKTKQGVSPELLSMLIEDTLKAPNVVLRGLMFFPPANLEEAERWFEKCAQIFAQCRAQYPDHFSILSMGTSQDYELALSKGSTMLRLGETLMGSRE